MRRFEQLADTACGHRAAEQVALRLGDAAVGPDQLELFVGLHAFDHHRQAQLGAEAGNAAQQGERSVLRDSFKE